MLDLSAAPHHDGSPLYVSDQSPLLGDQVLLRLRVAAGDDVDRVWVRSTPDAEPHYDEAVAVSSDGFATWWEARLDVANPVVRYRWLLSGPDGGYRWVNGSGTHPNDVSDAFDFVLSAHPGPPDWAADAIVYQIFPDRFARSAAADSRPTPAWAVPAAWDDPVVYTMPTVAKQFYGGDLDGIVDHLDHIVDLGFNTIYLTPFFPAPSNHRYDSLSFNHVDPLLGGDEALVRLVQAAHARGLRVIGDLTTNHSGVTHEWFAAAAADPSAPERQFYYFRPDGSYLGWYDVPSLPKFRFSDELLGRLTRGERSVAGRWLSEPFGLDGWRIDVANMTGRHAADDENHAVARDLRATMAEVAPDAVLVAEHCHDASQDLIGDGWHGAMNYAGFLRPIWAWLRSPDYQERFLGLPVRVPRLPATSCWATMAEFQAVIPWRALTASWSLICSHDTPRIRAVVGDPDVVAVAAGLLFTFPGAPMVFMGDELGGEGLMGEDARRPMPWDDPEACDRTTLERYRDLALLRGRSDALRRGSLRWLAVGDESLCYLRETADQALLCLATRADAEALTVSSAALGLAAGAVLRPVYGAAADLCVADDATLTLRGQGPSFSIWQVR